MNNDATELNELNELNEFLFMLNFFQSFMTIFFHFWLIEKYVRVERLIFNQKMVVLVPIWGVLHPPGPSIFSGDGSYGPQILPTRAL